MSARKETHRRLPPWLTKRISWGGKFAFTEGTLADLRLATVCSSAHCPNRHECYNEGTATFLILGRRCTRSCRFCAVEKGEPQALEADEPERVAEAARRMKLAHVVITSVTRDDLADGGSAQFERTIGAVRRATAEATVEVLTPDFAGRAQDILRVAEARPDVYNHNIETVPSLYPTVRPGADFERSVGLLALVKRDRPELLTKSGLMLGLGESAAQVKEVLERLREAGCDLLTLGQYLAPSSAHLAVERFVPPEEFEEYGRLARSMGFAGAASGPFVRSSYHAFELFRASKGAQGQSGTVNRQVAKNAKEG